MTILNLPNELLLQIVESLTRDGEVYALALTNRRLAAIAIPILHKLALEDKDGLTALQWATSEYPNHKGQITHPRSHESLVRLLLAKGVDIDYFEHMPFSCRTTDYDFILRHRASPAIHRAVITGNLAILRILLEHGANVNIENAFGDMALHWALESNRKEEIALLLLENGADVLTPTNDDERLKPLQKAVRKSTYAVVARILERGANVNDRDSRDATALHSAVLDTYNNRSIPLIRLLLESGADVSARDRLGTTSLHRAARTGSEMAIRLLLEKGAKVDAASNSRITPLTVAVYWRNGTAIEALLEAGADIFFTQRGVTIIDRAAGGSSGPSSSTKTVQLILEKPEQFKKYIGCNPGGGKAMSFAISSDCVDLVNLFLDNGFDTSAQHGIDFQNNGSQQSPIGTALHWAAFHGSEKVASLLLKRGVDTEIRSNSDRRTALEWAIYSHKHQIIDLFFENRRGIDVMGTKVSKKASGRKSGKHGNSFCRHLARFRQFFRS